jgi:hypothetical protein
VQKKLFRVAGTDGLDEIREGKLRGKTSPPGPLSTCVERGWLARIEVFKERSLNGLSVFETCGFQRHSGLGFLIPLKGTPSPRMWRGGRGARFFARNPYLSL